LVEAEIAARDASNTANRLKAAAFPVTKTLDGFDVTGSSVTQATFNHLQSLEWIQRLQNLAIIGPPGAG
jgi:DNA replication protein DnaC